MARSKRTIRASEIGAFVFCHRAWWYQRRGCHPMNAEALDAGSEYHSANAGRAQFAHVLQFIGWSLMLFSILFLIFSLF